MQMDAKSIVSDGLSVNKESNWLSNELLKDWCPYCRQKNGMKNYYYRGDISTAELEINPSRMDVWMDGTHSSIHPQNPNCLDGHPDGHSG